MVVELGTVPWEGWVAVELGTVPWEDETASAYTPQDMSGLNSECTSNGTWQESLGSETRGRGSRRRSSRRSSRPQTQPPERGGETAAPSGQRSSSKERVQTLLPENRHKWLQGLLELSITSGAAGAKDQPRQQRLLGRMKNFLSLGRGSKLAFAWRHVYVVLGPDGLVFWPPGGPQSNQPAELALRFIELRDVSVRGQEVTVKLKASAGDAKDSEGDCLVLRTDSDASAQRWEAAIRSGMVAKLCETLPENWDLSAIAESKRFVSKQSLSQDIVPLVQRLMDHCFVCKSTRDRKKREMPLRLQVTEVVRVENSGAWISYDTMRTRLQERRRSRDKGEGEHDESSHAPILTSVFDNEEGLGSVLGDLAPELDVNEHWLFHGTTEAAVQGISDSQFRLDLAGSHRGTMYGNGVYLAECSSKADEYAHADRDGNCTMLLCRASLGRTLWNCDKSPKGKELQAQCQEGYDSLCGDRETAVGTFREFVLYNSDQVYPAYIVHYRRVMQPDFLRLIAQGKNSRAWPGKGVILYAARLAEEHPDSVVRYRIILLLGNNARKVVPALTSFLRDERTTSRRVAAGVLRQLATSLAPTATMASVEFSSEAIGAMSMTAALPALLRASQRDTDEKVRESASAAVKEIKDYSAGGVAVH